MEIAPFKEGKFDSNRLDSICDETAVFPHQNKLKAIYIAVEDFHTYAQRVMPLEIDENGQVKDKRWRDFLELHNPVDDNLKGYMIDKRNNMIADYDNNGKEKMMERRLNLSLSQTISQEHNNTTEKITEKQTEIPSKTQVTADIFSAPKQTTENHQPAPSSAIFTQSAKVPETAHKGFDKMDKGERRGVIRSLRHGVNPFLQKTDHSLSETPSISQTHTPNNPQQISDTQRKMNYKSNDR